MSARKFNIAKKYTDLYKYPETWHLLKKKILDDAPLLVERCTGQELALILDLMYQQKNYGYWQGVKEG